MSAPLLWVPHFPFLLFAFIHFQFQKDGFPLTLTFCAPFPPPLQIFLVVNYRPQKNENRKVKVFDFPPPPSLALAFNIFPLSKSTTPISCQIIQVFFMILQVSYPLA